jgi:hypothetical protein
VPWRIVYISFFLSDSSAVMIYIALKMGPSSTKSQTGGREEAPLHACLGEIPVLYVGCLVEQISI